MTPPPQFFLENSLEVFTSQLQPDTHPLKQVITLVQLHQLLLLRTEPVSLGVNEAFLPPTTCLKKTPTILVCHSSDIYTPWNSELYFKFADLHFNLKWILKFMIFSQLSKMTFVYSQMQNTDPVLSVWSQHSATQNKSIICSSFSEIVKY